MTISIFPCSAGVRVILRGGNFDKFGESNSYYVLGNSNYFSNYYIFFINFWKEGFSGKKSNMSSIFTLSYSSIYPGAIRQRYSILVSTLRDYKEGLTCSLIIYV